MDFIKSPLIRTLSFIRTIIGSLLNVLVAVLKNVSGLGFYCMNEILYNLAATLKKNNQKKGNYL